MAISRSLRARFTVAFMLLAAVVSGFSITAAYLIFESFEDRMFGERLSSEMGWWVAQQQSGHTIRLPPGWRFYTAGEIPKRLASLAPGYHEQAHETGDWKILVRTHGDRRYVLVVDEGDFENTEIAFYTSLAIGGLAGVLIAAWLGWLMAGRVIAPVTALADAVQRDTRETELPSLAARDEIGALARAFAARTTELHRYLARERLFTGDVSHELRTPLTVIVGAAELIEARASDRPDLANAAARIRRASLDISENINVLLLLARAPETIDAPRIALTPLIEREIERCKPMLIGRPVKFRLTAPAEIWVYARPELATMAIGNLLRNACQYTPQGEVSVSLEPDRLVVEDTGPGVPEPVRTRLFERFARNHEQTTGSGLGLALVRRVAEHLNWEIHLEDRPTGGSRFIFTFPAI